MLDESPTPILLGVCWGSSAISSEAAQEVCNVAWHPAGRHVNRMQSCFSAGELLKQRQPNPSALKAEGPDVALGRAFILAWAKKKN